MVATHLHDRRRSVLAWGLPLGLWSAFIISIFPSIEDALPKATKGYPPALKEAFGVSELANVEQYLQAEMLSLIVPLALGYLAVRAVASGLLRRGRSGRLDGLGLGRHHPLQVLRKRNRRRHRSVRFLWCCPRRGGLRSVWRLAL